MLSIGLTGGIASGKSTVIDLFSELGIACCDADDISRQLTQAGSPALAQIVTQFGPEILAKDGQLDRARLRKIIFSCPEKRHQLEAILHPRIAEEIRQWIARQSGKYVVVSVPLLAESKRSYHFDRILVIETDPETQLTRATIRDNSTAAEIQAILSVQASAAQRRAIADDIIINNEDISALRRQVAELHRKYSKLGQGKPTIQD